MWTVNKSNISQLQQHRTHLTSVSSLVSLFHCVNDRACWLHNCQPLSYRRFTSPGTSRAFPLLPSPAESTETWIIPAHNSPLEDTASLEQRPKTWPQRKCEKTWLLCVEDGDCILRFFTFEVSFSNIENRMQAHFLIQCWSGASSFVLWTLRQDWISTPKDHPWSQKKMIPVWWLVWMLHLVMRGRKGLL